MICTKCGYTQEDATDFCPKCGSPMQENAQQTNYNQQMNYSQQYGYNQQNGYNQQYGYNQQNGYGQPGGYSFPPIRQKNIALCVVLSIVTCGIYLIYWMYKAGEKVAIIRRANGMQADSSTGVLYLVLSIFGLAIVSYCLIQNELNQVGIPE